MSATLRPVVRAAAVVGHALGTTATVAYGPVFPERTPVAHLPE